MATKVVMEALSPTMEEGRLVEWKKGEGEKVSTGDVLAEVETDKAVMELVARTDGVLLKQMVADGATVPVADIVGWIGQAGESIPGADAPTASAAPKTPATAEPAAVTPAPTGGAHITASTVDSGRIKASPLARKMAAEAGINLTTVAGSGPDGRIVRRDLDSLQPGLPAAAPAPAGGGYTDIPLSQMRKTIARRLAQSIGPIPTFYLTAEADMERAWEMRQALLARDEGKFSVNDLIIRSTAAALAQHPWVNSWWTDNGIRQWHEIHIGVAVAVDEGLITPIVRHAGQKSLRQISSEVRELAGRAREKKLKPEEYTGGTFSISNLGMFGIEAFTAIINPPEVAILAVGRIEEKPVVMNGELTVRRRMKLTLSCDHRVVDGATGAEFLKALVGMLENPMAILF